jgi:hypothetical protein
MTVGETHYTTAQKSITTDSHSQRKTSRQQISLASLVAFAARSPPPSPYVRHPHGFQFPTCAEQLVDGFCIKARRSPRPLSFLLLAALRFCFIAQR